MVAGIEKFMDENGNSRDAMAYVYGVERWHGLGNLVNDCNDSGEVLEKGGLKEWDLVKVPLGFPAEPHLWEIENDPKAVPKGFACNHVPGMWAIFRKKDRKMISTYSVRDEYHIIQNEEIFRVLDQFPDLQYHTAGSLNDGKRVFVLCTFKNGLSEGAQIRPDDKDSKVMPFLLAHTSHAGEGSLVFDLTLTEVVCWNTLMAAEASAWAPIRIMHRKNAEERMEGAVEALSKIKDLFSDTTKTYQEWAQQRCTMDEWKLILRGSLGIHLEKEEEIIPPITKRRMNRLTDLFTDGRGRRGETMWDAYGAFTEYTTRFRGGEGLLRSNPSEAIWFGSSRDMERNAVREIKRTVKNRDKDIKIAVSN